ncbi:methyltransferase domain-containing protein [Pyxidicoccus xibeiensis]|uniref:methyltransferase domain-containing protein n=1 Tax=Pyxidicoccus xibeiensis TaxID=2906759 RepID=UPI0020A70B6D|nr:methyltransferase domain-containing protein [Pyxidicoccus xibeiensis]MCP3136889.1 methyltransferase domain-containing protein [Pyxidicoccus xibeiensis]
MRAEAPKTEARRDEVAGYYDAKTERILQRYGPGPRVHYHAGLVDAVPPPGAPADALREHIHGAQEALLDELARAARPFPDGGDVLDVGCGLGGGALYWATRHHARVTAVTNVPAHAELVAGFAESTGLGGRVKPLLCDALAVPGRACFDAVVAVESACYLQRAEWFRRVRTLLRPGGVVAIADCFLGRPELAGPFDRYWRTHIGSLDEYLSAAHAAGLELEVRDDVSSRVVGFWSLTLELLAHERAAAASGLHPLRALAQAGRGESSREHLRLQQALMDGGLEYALLVLRRPG